MSYQHRDLAAGRWGQLTFLEQMANIASEVERALKWKAQARPAFSERAFERALELIDLTLKHAGPPTRRREVARVREALVDYFCGTNQHASTDVLWTRYFSPFTYAARRNR